MAARDEAARAREARPEHAPGPPEMARVLVANAVPVLGVWFLGWGAERPLFFYWLDGLLAMWGLGVVAAVVSSRETTQGLGTTGVQRWLIRSAVIALVLAILSLPSLIAGAMVLGSLRRDLWHILGDVFSSRSGWAALAVVVASYAWQTVSELLWQPALTIRASGEARANLFIHRSLVMGLLVFWSRWQPPPRWALAVCVLLVACLFTVSQLWPDRYLRLIGLRRPARGRTARTASGDAVTTKTAGRPR